MEILPFLVLPFVASLILTGIHAYLGVHVVERGVIFVDLALAQIAALGATIAILMGLDPHGNSAYWMSLGFTFIGALIFSFVRSRHKRIPLEAFIGITYAVASAAAMLFADRIGTRLAIGWTMGTVVSALGCYFSVLFDTPTGATIVCTFGAVLVCMAIAKSLFFKVRRHTVKEAEMATEQLS